MSTDTKHTSLKLLLLLGLFAYCIGSAIFGTAFLQGPNNRNVTIDTTVNITHSLPTVLQVIIQGGIQNITLIAGNYENITCNATIQDWDGWSAITNVTATFFQNTTAWNASDDNNTHYTDSNCTLGANDGMYLRNATCVFPVMYYANVGTWICNVTATSDYLFNESVNRSRSNYNVTNISALYALNVTTLIDYGNLAVGDTSDPQQANVTNLGNKNINISVKGYGANLTDGLAMVCDIGNISVMYEKYNATNNGRNLASYTNLTSTQTKLNNFIVFQQTNESQQSINATYWVLFVPPNPHGRCNGSIIFQAEA